ncbi:MAG: hypothetical protein PVF74_15220 [Anaerolineales bacterium]|jgi:hypothetical protein
MNDPFTKLFFYFGWVVAGVISLSIAFIISMVVDSFVFTEIFGETIMVAGQPRITEDYMLPYAFIPWFGIIIGIVQYHVLKLRLSASRWWILTTTIGWSLIFLGLGLFYRPLGNVYIPENAWYLIMGGIITGLVLGVSQWLVLRDQVMRAAWWIPANIFGFGVAGYIFADISGMYDAIFAFTIPPITTGIALLLILDVLSGGEFSGENAPL